MIARLLPAEAQCSIACGAARSCQAAAASTYHAEQQLCGRYAWPWGVGVGCRGSSATAGSAADTEEVLVVAALSCGLGAGQNVAPDL